MRKLLIPTGRFRFYHKDSCCRSKPCPLGVLEVTEDSTRVVVEASAYLLRHFPDGPQDIQKFKRWYSLTTNPSLFVCRDGTEQEFL